MAVIGDALVVRLPRAVSPEKLEVAMEIARKVIASTDIPDGSGLILSVPPDNSDLDDTHMIIQIYRTCPPLPKG